MSLAADLQQNVSTPDDLQPDPRYPIGRFATPTGPVDAAQREDAMGVLGAFPEQLRNAVSGLNHAQIDTPYRDGGWTVRQLVHHVADSHAQAMFRFKMALSEDWPMVYGYPEAKFALLHDSAAAPLEWSLEMIEATHARWGMLLQSLTEEQWARGFTHSERGRTPLTTSLMLYRWHAQHHLAHITHLRAARGW